MSRITHTRLVSALVVAGLLAGAGLVQSADAQSIAPERALLNQTFATGSEIGVDPIHPSPIVALDGAALDGERALLGRTQALRTWASELTFTAAEPLAVSLPIDGERALLGRWPASQPRSAGDWARRPGSDERSTS